MAVDKKISQLASGAPAQAGDEYVVARSGANFKLTLTNIAASMPPIGATTPNTGSFTSLTNSGNLTFSSTGQRITGDMSNATQANRLAFQTSTTNGNTSVFAIPNGTGTLSQFGAFSNSDPTNASAILIAQVGTTESRIVAGASGTGTLTPMTFFTNNAERMRLDTSGNLGIGTASPSTWGKFAVVGSANAGVANFIGNASLTGSNPTYTGSIRLIDNPTSSTASSGGVEFLTSTFGSGYGWKIASIDSSGVQMTFAMRQNSASWTEVMRLDASGNVGIGAAAAASVKLHIQGTLPTSGTNSFGVAQDVTFPNGATGQTQVFRSVASTAAAAFTVPNLIHYFSVQGTIGATSAVTNQYGFYADSTLTGATNNYGFYSNIAAGSNRWNFYAAGTAQNYFAGNVGIGTTTTTLSGNVFKSAISAGTLSLVGLNNTGNTNKAWGFLIGDSGAGGAGRFHIAQIVDGSTSGFGGGPLVPIISADPPTTANTTPRIFVNADAEVFVGGTTDQGAYNLQCNGTGVWGAGAYVNGSDARLKDNIQSLDSGLDVVKAMRPVTFQYKPEYSKDQNVQPGFIAQELQTAMAGKPYLEGVVQEGTNHLNVAYQNIIPILVKAIQELEAKVAALEAK